MPAKNPAEQIIVKSYDPKWIQQRARLLLLLGMEKESVIDFASFGLKQVGGGNLDPRPVEFPDFDSFFSHL